MGARQRARTIPSITVGGQIHTVWEDSHPPTAVPPHPGTCWGLVLRMNKSDPLNTVLLPQERTMRGKYDQV